MSSTTPQRWEYRELKAEASAAPEPAAEAVPPVPAPALSPGLTEAEVAVRVASALEEAERRWTAAAEEHEARRRAQMAASLAAFAAERARYLSEVETEVVQLALAVARKILGREASLDPQLLQALVRLALDRMGAGTTVRLRVPPGELVRWQEGSALAGSIYEWELVPDASVAGGECLVETDLGAASFGLEVQLKEIERGVLDLLERRPQAAERGSPPRSRFAVSAEGALAGAAA